MRIRRPVIQVGNSLAIRLTKAEARKLGVRKGDTVEADLSAPGRGLRIDARYFVSWPATAPTLDEEIEAAFEEELPRAADGR